MDLSKIDRRYETHPYDVYADLFTRTGALWSAAHQAMLVGDQRLIREVLLDPEAYTVENPFRTSRRVIGPSMLDLEGERHTSLRRTLLELVSLREVRGRWAAAVADAVDAAIVECLKRGETETEAFIYQVPLAIASAVSGYPIGTTSSDFVGLKHIVRVIDGDVAALPEAIAARAAIEAKTEVLLSSSQVTNATLIAVLQRQLRAGEVSFGLAKSFMTLFLASAMETTACGFGTVIWALAKAPSMLAAIRAGQLTAEQFVLDTLRRWPPLQFTARFATSAQRVGDTPVPRGAVVTLCLGAAQHQARTGDLARPRADLVFGAGEHSCPGRFLATAELVRFVQALADRGLTVRAPAIPSTPSGNTFHRPKNFTFALERGS